MEKIINYMADNWLPIASFTISIIALLITWKKNIYERKYTNDKELLEQLKQSMSTAFESISKIHNKELVPFSDRLGWITAARHITRYRELRENLKTELYRTICEEQEEYWRHKFYILMKLIDSKGFFSYIDPDRMEKNTIDPKSAAVVYSFSQWKKTTKDPIEDLDLEELIKEYQLFSPINMHFRMFIENNFPGIAAKIKDS